MKRIVVLTQNPSFGDAIRAVAPVALFGVMCFSEVDDAVACLQTGAVDIVVFETPLSSAGDQQQIAAMMAAAPDVSMIVIKTSSNVSADAEADAYTAGVEVVLQSPVRPTMLRGILMRSVSSAPAKAPAPAVPTTALCTNLRDAYRPLATSAADLLDTLAGTLQKHGGINRVFILLTDKTGGMVCKFSRSTLNPAVVSAFRFPPTSGIKANFMRRGGVVTTGNADPESLRELTAFGCSAAIPIRAAGNVIGAVLVDEHVTGEPLTQNELREIFEIMGVAGDDYTKLLEIEVTRQGYASLQETLAAVPFPVITVSNSCELLYSSRCAQELFGSLGRFQDIPQDIGSLLYRAVKTGAPDEPVIRSFPDGTQRLLAVSVTTTGATLTVLHAPAPSDLVQIDEELPEEHEVVVETPTPTGKEALVPAAA